MTSVETPNATITDDTQNDNPGTTNTFQNRLIHADCLDYLKTVPDNYFDSLVCDPPAGINFMGKDFDKNRGGMLNWINWLSEIMSEAMRTMKPGACGLVWSIPRTSHWTGMALELAGFKLIDIVHACNGSGFPKSQDISKHIDALYGAKREILGKNPNARNGGGSAQVIQKNYERDNTTAPYTPQAKQYDGWKTPALKPAVEGWWLVQKPISESSIARNILKHGVGGLNIEACRIGTETRLNQQKDFSAIHGNKYGSGAYLPNLELTETTGRYPANLILSCSADCDGDNHSPDCPVSVIGEQSGICTSGGSAGNRSDDTYFKGKKGINTLGGVGASTGTAARYFKQLPFDPETVNSVYYQAKASTKDRTCNGTVENTHPTVKSTALMEYFIKLITPEGGIVLDPFMGSGTTAIAAINTNRNFICIEKESDYHQIALNRVNAHINLLLEKAKKNT